MSGNDEVSHHNKFKDKLNNVMKLLIDQDINITEVRST